MESKQLIANLYGIRAGLSLISKEADKVNDSIKKLNNQAKRFSELEKKRSKALSKLSECQEKLYNHRNQKLEDDVASLPANEKEKRKMDSRQFRREIDILEFVGSIVGSIFFIYIGSMVAAFLFLYIGQFFGLEMAQSLSNVYVILRKALYINIPISVVLSIILFIITLISDWKNIVKQSAQKQEKTLQELSSFNSEHASLEREVRYAESNLDAVEKEQVKFQEENSIVLSEENQKISYHAKRAKIIYHAMRKAYSSTLIEQDWENLDLIIFYFITGRAETIKESLQLVDRERQTQRIVESVRFASREICSSIKAAFAELGSILEASFNMINDRLDSIEDGVDTIKEGINSLNDSNRILISKTEMNTALVAKAQRTSDELAKDLKYLREKW